MSATPTVDVTTRQHTRGGGICGPRDTGGDARSGAAHNLGFTLIEVLVALGIVAITLAAAARASSALIDSSQRQSDMVLAQLCAENRLIAARLQGLLPAIGEGQTQCEQAGRVFQIELLSQATPNPSFRRLDVRVLDEATPLLRLSTVIGRY